jgi:hypothetical protein
VVSRDGDDPLALDPGQLLPRERVLVGVAVVGDVPGDHDEVGCLRVDLVDRGPQQLLPVAISADVDVRDLSDPHEGESRLICHARPDAPGSARTDGVGSL